MPHYAVAASVLLMFSEVVEVGSRSELDALIRTRLKENGQWKLDAFTLDDATVQVVHVEPQAVPVVPVATSAA